MSHFEYLMVMVSIILGLGATQALRGLSKLAQSSQPFAPVALWSITLFYLHVQVWWGYWDMVGVTDWTQLSYYLIVFLPCSLFAAIELLVPIGAGAQTDWRTHFFNVRPWFFGTVVAFQALATVTTYIVIEVPLTHPYRIVQVTTILLATGGLFAKSVRAHIWIAAAFMAVTLTGQVLFRLNPWLSG